MTRERFLNAYKEAVQAEAQDNPWPPGRMDTFFEGVSRGLVLKSTAWNKDTPANQKAWRAIGGKGKMTWKALFALPLEG